MKTPYENPPQVKLTEAHQRHNELAMRSQQKLEASYDKKWPDEASFVRAALKQMDGLGSPNCAVQESKPLKLTEEHQRWNEQAMKSQAKLEEDYKTRYAQPGSFQKAAAEQFDRVRAASKPAERGLLGTTHPECPARALNA